MNFDSLTFEQAKNELRFCDSFSRLPDLLDLSYRMEDPEWLRLLGDFWPGLDNVGFYQDDLANSPLGERQGVIREMMTVEDLEAYAALPDILTIYRGCYKSNKWGLSWSLSKQVAEKFPTLLRYKQVGEQPLLVTATIKKTDVIAVKVDRNEQEIIAWRPKHISTTHIKAARDSC